MCTQTTQYYEYSDQKHMEYNEQGFANNLYGKYTVWYENGQIKLQGQYYQPIEFEAGGMICNECEANIMVGDWVWYNEDGSISSSNTFKEYISYWDNGNIQSAGTLVQGSSGVWFRDRLWIFWDEVRGENGKLGKEKKRISLG